MSGSVGSLTVTLTLDGDKFTVDAQRAGTALTSLSTNINTVTSSAKNLDSAISTHSMGPWVLEWIGLREAIYGVQDAIKGFFENVIEINSEIQKTTILLQSLSDAGDEAGKKLQAATDVSNLIGMAKDTPFSLDTLTDTFVKFKTTGIDPTKGAMQGLVDAVAAFGGSDQRLQRAAYAIQEMAGRGVVSLTNLRRQLGQDIPGAVQLMARSMNMTVAQLDAAVTKGTLDSMNAINQMTAEMERTYGGAAERMMDSYTGRVAQLHTTFVQLALAVGGQVKPAMDEAFSGSPIQGTSSYQTFLDQLKRINDTLNSPEMSRNVAELNKNLAALAEDFGDVTEKAIEFLPIILDVVKTLGEMALAEGIFKTLSAGITSTFSAFSAVKDFFAVGELGFSAATLEMATFENGLRNVGSGLLSAAGAVKNFGISILGSFIPEIGLATEGFEGLIAAFTGFAAGFAAFVLPAAVAVGIAVLIEHMRKLSGETNVAIDALERLRNGDISSGTQDQGAKQIDALKVQLAAIKDYYAQLQAIKEGKQEGTTGRKFGNEANMTSVNTSLSDNTFITKADLDSQKGQEMLDAFQQRIEQTEQIIGQGTLDVQNAGFARIKQAADVSLQTINQSIANQLQVIDTKYNAAMDVIQAKRQMLDADPNTPASAITALNKEADSVTDTRYQAELQLYQDFINQKKTLLDKAQTDFSRYVSEGNQTLAQQAAYQMGVDKQAITDLTNTMEERKAIYAEDERSRGMSTSITSDDSKKFNTAMETFTKTADEQIAEYTAKMEDAGVSTAKLNTIISEFAAKDAFTPAAQKAREAAAAVDSVRAAYERFESDQKASKQIDLGIERATEQINEYEMKLKDPEAPEATRSFDAQIANLAAQINILGNNMDQNQGGILGFGMAFATSAKEVALMSRALQAMDMLKSANVLAQVSTIVTKADQYYASTGTAVEKAQRQKALATTQYTNTLKLLNQELTKDPNNKMWLDAKAQLEAKQSLWMAANQERTDMGADAASRPGNNDIDQLSESVANLKAKLTDSDSELAKWTAKLDGPNGMKGVSAAARAEIEKLTQDLFALQTEEKNYDKLKSNVSSFDSSGDQAKEEQELQSAMGQTFSARSKQLDVEKSILSIQIKQDEIIKEAAAHYNAMVSMGVMSQSDANSKIADITKDANNQAAIQSTEDLRNAIMALQSQTDEMTDKEHHSSAQIIADLKAQEAEYFKIIAASKMSTAEQQQAIQIVTAYYTAKVKEEQQANQDFVQKTAQQWGDISQNMGKFAEEGFTKIDDAMATMLEHGKVKWSELADWAIDQLDRIVMHMIESGIMNFFMNLLTGGASGGASMASSNAVLNGPNGGVGGVYHTGGIVGLNEGASRFVDFSLFSGAPRYHTGGISGDEMPAILQPGEGVFTQGQMAAIGDLNATSYMMASALSNMANTAQTTQAIQSSFDQPGPSGNAAGSPMSGNVTVNLTNNSSASLNATVGQPRFTGKDYILDVVLQELNKPGNLRTAVRGATA